VKRQTARALIGCAAVLVAISRWTRDLCHWLLSVARLTPHKGIDTGLRALARLGERYPDLGYAVVGSGEQLPALQAMAQGLGVADRVRFSYGGSGQRSPGPVQLRRDLLRILQGDRRGGGGIRHFAGRGSCKRSAGCRRT
jgi:hypothetical protein